MRWPLRPLARVAGWLVMTLALGFLGHELWRSNAWSLVVVHASEVALAVAVAIPIYGVCGFLLAEAWRQLLGPGPAEAHPWRHRALYGRTQIAKYLPGNCFHFVGRQIMGRRLGHPHGALAFASLAETILLLLAAGALALPVMWSQLIPMLGVLSRWLAAASAGLVVALIWRYRRRLRDWWARLAPGTHEQRAGWGARVLKAGLLHAAFFAITGLLLWLLAAGLQTAGAGALGLSAAISVLAIAWCAGFVVPGSSAGVGVREAALVLALEPYLVGDGALVVAVALRLVTTLGDLMLFGLCWIIRFDHLGSARAAHAGS